MVRGAGCREPNPRIPHREKNVLDMPSYRSGDYTNYDPGESPAAASNSVVSVAVRNRTSRLLKVLHQPNIVVPGCGHNRKVTSIGRWQAIHF